MVDCFNQARYSPGMATPARRSPAGEARQRDAERTRQALVDAALVEFAAKGREGARVHDIAARAGVNKQLISYYFGGKEGLYRTLVERWWQVEADVVHESMPMEDVVVAYVDLSRTHPDLFRLFLWEALAAVPAMGPPPGRSEEPPEVVDIARRQAAGELSADFDPSYLLLIMMAVTIAPLTLSHQVEHFTGLAPGDPVFVERFREQVRLLVRHLGP